MAEGSDSVRTDAEQREMVRKRSKGTRKRGEFEREDMVAVMKGDRVSYKDIAAETLTPTERKGGEKTLTLFPS